MLHPNAIAALTALANSDNLEDTLPALARVRDLLGEEADALRPLLETLALRAGERADLKRQVRAQTNQLRARRWVQI